MPKSAATKHNSKGCENVNYNSPFPYEDILHLPYPRVSKRAKMSMVERAAQFAPFAALTGFDSAISETARLTGPKVELDESEQQALNLKIQYLMDFPGTKVMLTYFVPDLRKEGGCYTQITSCVKKVDIYNQQLILTDGQSVSLNDILELTYEEK